MKKINFNSDLLVSGGLVVLGIAQMVLTNKKQTSDISKLKDEVTKNVMENLNKNS